MVHFFQFFYWLRVIRKREFECEPPGFCCLSRTDYRVCMPLEFRVTNSLVCVLCLELYFRFFFQLYYLIYNWLLYGLKVVSCQNFCGYDSYPYVSEDLAEGRFRGISFWHFCLLCLIAVRSITVRSDPFLFFTSSFFLGLFWYGLFCLSWGLFFGELLGEKVRKSFPSSAG